MEKPHPIPRTPLSDRFTALLPRLIELLEKEYRDMPRPPASPTGSYRELLSTAHRSLAELAELEKARR